MTEPEKGAPASAPAQPPRFDYDAAFSRNLGWVTPLEQRILREKTVAVAGMGGVGGVHLTTLTRLGVGGFHIADLDRFGVENFNRQIGADMTTVGRPKVDVMAEAARAINPELRLNAFPNGVDDANLDAFLDGVDLFVDGFDFFVLDIRAKCFRRCRELGIPAITAAPLGMGTSWLVFMPDGMSFEKWFRLEGLPPERQYLHFLMGLAPHGWHRAYLVDPSRVDLAAKRGPSTAMACQLCAGVTGVEALKILLGRGDVRAAPWRRHFDAYRSRFAAHRMPGGNANPLQRARIAAAWRIYGRMAQVPPPAAPTTAPPEGEIYEILDAGRWAPSGDNVQPWRFRAIDDRRVEITLRADPANVYEYDSGRPTALSAGFLLETLRVAASVYGRRLDWTAEGDVPGDGRIAVDFAPEPDVGTDPRAPFVELRSVDRRPYRNAPLAPLRKAALEATLGDELEAVWLEERAARRAAAGVNAAATEIRLRIPEAFETHRRMIDWSGRDSPTGIPADAVGLDAATLRVMRWSFGDWRRQHALNRYALGAKAATLQLDLLPGLACAAHVAMRWRGAPPTEPAARRDALLRAGMRLQRFWLEATRLGLVMQPSLAPLAFAWYAAHDVRFTEDAAMRAKAGELLTRLRGLGAGGPDELAFFARVGAPRARRRRPRSVRRPLVDFLEADQGGASTDERLE